MPRCDENHIDTYVPKPKRKPPKAGVKKTSVKPKKEMDSDSSLFMIVV